MEAENGKLKHLLANAMLEIDAMREVLCHDLPKGERVCPHCGTRLSEFGVEVIEQLDSVPNQGG